MALASGAQADITIDFIPIGNDFQPGRPLTVEIIADIEDPIIGFGFDWLFDAAFIEPSAFMLSELFTAAGGTDSDSIVALAYPDPVVGEDVLLGTLQFDAVSEGDSIVSLHDVTGGRNTGFAGRDGLSVNTSILEGLIQIRGFTTGKTGDGVPGGGGGGSGGGGGPNVPEPTTMMLCGFGALSLLTRRRSA